MGRSSACAAAPGDLTINSISESDTKSVHSAFRAIVILSRL
jgi:hypothetical protein